MKNIFSPKFKPTLNIIFWVLILLGMIEKSGNGIFFDAVVLEKNKLFHVFFCVGYDT